MNAKELPCFKMGESIHQDCPAIKFKADKREALAAYAHEAWSGWMKYLFRKTEQSGFGMVIPQWAVERWARQMNTPYAELPESEKESDRVEADRMLNIMTGK